MDTDDCTEKQKSDYLNKNMFKNHWAYPNIIPINNSPELESVLNTAKIPFKRKGNKQKKEYISIFPTDDKYKQQNSHPIQLKEFMEKLQKDKNTNLDEFIKFCLDIADQNLLK